MISVNRKNDKKHKIIENLLTIHKISEEQGWDFYYDKELDNLYFSSEIIPEGSVLENISDEMAIYITHNNDIKGIFIEYFSKNFIKHKKKYKKLLSLFKKDNKIIIEVDEKNKDQVELYKDSLILELLKDFPIDQEVNYIDK